MKKKIVAASLATLAFGGIGLAACDTGDTGGHKPGGVSKGIGSADATKDVKMGAPQFPYGTVEIPVTVTNHSSKTSDYNIEAAVYDTSGAKVATADTFIEQVEPGGHARDKLIALPSQSVYDGSAKLTTVERTASMP